MPHLFDPLALGDEGRISPTDLGLYSDANEAFARRVKVDVGGMNFGQR